jgi:predicted  nucleic acid-binding Zn-ribbon protein
LKDKICLLIKLQHCDTRLRELRRRKEEGPIKVRKIEEDLESEENKAQEVHTQLEELKKERHKIEKEVQELDGKVEKSSVKLSHIKSNKEYTAALKEIEDLKRNKFITEDKIIEVMEKIAELEQGSAEENRRLVELREQAEKEKKRILEELAGLEQDLIALEERKQHLIKDVDPELLKKYFFLYERRNGLAVSAVVTGVCQTCHLGIPPQKFNELIRGNAVMTCPHCHRIMYWGEDEDFQKVVVSML